MAEMTTEEKQRLRERMSSLADDELLRIVEVEYNDYRPEALEYAKAELDSRGMTYGTPASRQKAARGPTAGYGSSDGSPEEDDQDLEDDGADDLEAGEDEFKPAYCSVCGSEVRTGYLFGGRGEMTVVFSDNNEERFVELHGCPKCKYVRLIVDFETDVAD